MDYVKTSEIMPDPDQPRKYFSAEKMRTLMQSIKQEGIITPLVVEKVGKGYLLIDGERRYRAALELKLDKVPVVVEEPKKAVERMVRQFTIQEQREGWTPVEKAMALIRLSNELGLKLPETCKLLNTTDGEARLYISFAALADKETWVRNEVPISFADKFRSVQATAKRISENILKKEWTLSDAKKLEGRVIRSIKDGTVSNSNHLTRLTDAFNKDPKALKKYLESNSTTPTELFLETGAQTVSALRNAVRACSYVAAHGNRFLENPNVELSKDQIDTLKSAQKVIAKLLDLVE